MHHAICLCNPEKTGQSFIVSLEDTNDISGALTFKRVQMFVMHPHPQNSPHIQTSQSCHIFYTTYIINVEYRWIKMIQKKKYDTSRKTLSGFFMTKGYTNA